MLVCDRSLAPNSDDHHNLQRFYMNYLYHVLTYCMVTISMHHLVCIYKSMDSVHVWILLGLA